jgi:hypothetical protein
MGSLKLYGMRSAYDEVMAAGIKRQHEPPRIVGDLLQSEIAEKQARSIRYQMTVAKLPLAKDIEEFDFTGTPINEGLVRELANGSFVTDQRNVVLIGGTGTGKTHLAIAIARALIRNGTRGRFYNVVDLVNRLETETRGGKQGRLADYMTRLDFVILDELGYQRKHEACIVRQSGRSPRREGGVDGVTFRRSPICVMKREDGAAEPRTEGLERCDHRAHVRSCVLICVAEAPVERIKNHQPRLFLHLLDEREERSKAIDSLG